MAVKKKTTPMRCNTPGKRILSKSFIKGKVRVKAPKKRPKPISFKLRILIFLYVSDVVALLWYENAIEVPTMNKKNGKTKSVGVYPCHWAWSKGA